MQGAGAREIIINAHIMLHRQFKGMELWVMVRELTGHGSGNSIQICKTANLDPFQVIKSGNRLRNMTSDPI